jgi:cytochrome c oxidase subunit 1
VLGVSTFIILYNMVWSIYRGKVAGSNPWRALTLEWMTSSPPPAYNFRGDPIPFDDPYGYGTEAAQLYIDTMANQLDGPYRDAPKPSGKGQLPAATQPAGD